MKTDKKTPSSLSSLATKGKWRKINKMAYSLLAGFSFEMLRPMSQGVSHGK